MKKLYLFLVSIFMLIMGVKETQAQCSAAFNYSTNNLVVQFMDSSFTRPGAIIIYDWYFGDGNFSSQTNPTHTYAQAGTYNVCLTIYDSLQTCFDSICYNVTVTASQPQPCNVSYSYSVNPNNTVSFTSSITGGTAPFIYSWHFGTSFPGGGTSNQANPIFTYNAPGAYGVTLTITDAMGDSCMYYDTVYVNNCNANFSSQVGSNGLVSFNNLSTPNHSQVAFDWNFGDGSPLVATRNPTHTYTSSGTYVVTLNMFDSLGNQSCNYSDSIVINLPPPCQAGFNASINQNTLFIQNTALNFSNISYDFGDGTGSTQANPTHIYSQSGSYTVCQIVSDSSTNCIDSICSVITIVVPPPCQADFNFTTNLDSLFIQNTASNYSSISYDFGDGTISNQTDPIHIYSQSGTYTICQTVSDSSTNCIDSICKIVTISIPPPCQAGFSYTIMRRTIQIQDQAANYNDILYNFGDGGASVQANPSYTYQTNGTYIICQRVRNTITGCVEIFCDTVIISVPVCKAGFTSSTNLDTVQFTNTAVNYTSIQYDFGDGDTSSFPNPTHIYDSSGTYVICQTVTDPLNNCSDTFCDSVVVIVPPPCIAGFSYSENNGVVNFQNAAINYTSISYDFGDGNGSNQANPTYTYSQSGSYIVRQTVSNGARCTNVYTDTITVHVIPPCNAGFNYSFIGDSVLFQSTATSFNRIVYYFGDGDSSTLINPYHAYQQSGTYAVKQLVYNDSINCVDSISDSIAVTVSRSCVAKYVIAIDTNQRGTLFLVNTSSSDNTHSYFWDFGDGNTATGRTPTHQYTSNQRFNICLTVSDSVQNCTSTYCDSIGLDSNGNVLKSNGFILKVINGSFIGIEESKLLDQFSIYPNPASYKITIDNNSNLSSIDYMLLTIEGREVLRGVINGVKEEVDVTDLKQGMYFLRLFNNESSIVKRIIKQ